MTDPCASSHAAQLGALPDAYDQAVRPPGSGADARRTLESAAALYKSAFTGQPVLAGEIAAGDPYYPATHGNHPHWSPPAMTIPTR